MKHSGWDERLSVKADGKGLVGHAGAVLLRRCADRVGLTAALTTVLPAGTGPGWRERGPVLVGLAVAIVLGAVNLADAEALLVHQAALFGASASDSTMRRALAVCDAKVLARIAKARARIRRHVWSLLAVRPGGFPWLSVAGKRLAGWIIVDIDATIITSASKKQGAAATFKRTFGFHPLAAWCANTHECLAMLLRPGNAGANTVADHLEVLAEALEQIPGSTRAKILIRIDGAGATHELLIARRVRPSRRQVKKLTDFERATGWRYAICATNIHRLAGVAGSHQPQWLDALHRSHASVEDRVRTNKAMSLHNLPSADWTVNSGWVLAANLAADLDAWTRLLGLHDEPDLAHAEPATMRYRLYHLPAKLTRHARRRWLTLSATWPWREAFTTCWQRLGALPALA